MQDVRKDRNKFLGGSDIAAILGISKFKTRWELLQEKAGIRENDFEGNVFTEYGNTMEPKIREYVNNVYDADFVEDKIYKDFIRCHTDGTDKNKQMILEVKTTSVIHDRASDYPYYLCQLLLEMDLYNYDRGVLAVYERPADFDETFNPMLMYNYEIHRTDWKEFLDEIWTEINTFRADWLRLLENPELTEQDFQPQELVATANKVMALETQIEAMKQIEKDLAQAKAELKAGMEKFDIKSWTTPSGYKITLVPDGEPTEKEVFDELAFSQDNPETYMLYLKPVTKKGKAGYVRITPPKGDK